MTDRQGARLRSHVKELGINLESPALDRIGLFFSLLFEWNPRLRLTGERSEDILIEKHAVDSLAPVRYLPESGMVVDVGTGAGFPGIILACCRPEIRLALVESRRRPVSFLREVLRQIPLPLATVYHDRAEKLVGELGGRATMVIGRALPVKTLFSLSRQLLSPSGVAVAMQTPSTVERSVRIAAEWGLRSLERFDYQLPGREQRALLTFRRDAVS